MITALFMAWAIGANDSAKAVGTAVGSGVLGFKRAVLLIGIFATLGVLFGGSGVSGTVSGLAEGMSAGEVGLVLFSAANLIGLPVSSGQAIVGAISGLGLYKGERVNLKLLAGIAKGWIIAPVFAGAISYVLMTFLA